MSDTLRFIQGLAARSDRPLNQFAVDHLVEILRHRRALDEQSGRDYSLAMHLIRQRTTVAARTKAFRFSAPFPQLQVPLVARPRNHHNLQREVARFWRPLRILDRPQHRCQIPLQLDLKFALVGRQDDGVDEATSASEASVRVSGCSRACANAMTF